MVNLWLIMVNNWNNHGIIYIYNIYLGKFPSRPKPVLPNPGIMVYFREIIPIHGRTIQVSEIL